MARQKRATEARSTAFAAWLDAEIAAMVPPRTRSQLAAGIDSTRQTVNAWFTDGRTPTPELCRRIAKYLGKTEREVQLRAGHLAPGHDDPVAPELPSWFTKAIEGLEDWELQVVARTAQGLREARDHPGPA